MSHRRRVLTVEKWCKDLNLSLDVIASTSSGLKKISDIISDDMLKAYRLYVETVTHAAFTGCGMQVYMLDGDFVNSILNEKWIELLPSVIDKVPHEGFYVTLPNVDEFEGAVVYVKKIDDLSEIDARVWEPYTQALQNDRDSDMCIFKKNNRAFMVRHENGDLYGVMIMHIPNDIDHMYDEYTLPFVDISLIANVIAYVCSKNADIHVSYKPSVTSRKKNVSKATWHDVGFRIGAELREYERIRYQKKPHQGGTVRPHMRRAHWHHYWIGPRDGNRQLVLKWMPPMAIGVKNGEIKEVTGHMVQSNE